MPRTTTTKQPEQTDIYTMVQQVIERDKCRTDPVYFIATYLKFLDPREDEGERWLNIQLWDKQIEYIQALNEAYSSRRPLVVEKPRDVGATYITLGWAFWKWLFSKEFLIVVGSRKEEEVDKAKDRKRSTLFAKLDGFLSSIPQWLLPKDFDKNKDRAHLLLFNPETKSSFVGESSNGDFGKSNRGSMVILDEYAAWDLDVFGSVLHVCKFTVAISTIENEDDYFHNLCKRAKAGGYLFEFVWQDNPNHNEKWLEDMQSDSSPIEFARNVLKSYESARGDPVYPQVRKCPKGPYEYNPDWPLICFWDFGLSDETYLGFLQRDPETLNLYLIDEVVAAEQDILWFVNFVPGLAKPIIPNPYIYTEELDYKIDEHRLWKRPVIHFGDPNGKQRNQITKTSIFNELSPYGIRPKCDPKLYIDMGERTRSARRALGRLHINDQKCKWFLKSFRGYHYPEKKSKSHANDTPEHDENSHACTAFEFFAISERFIPDEQDTFTDRLRPRNPWSIRKRSA